MTMPETTIGKNSYSNFWEDKVRLPKQFIISSPSSNTIFLKDLDQF
jgi:hypothetical protein